MGKFWAMMFGVVLFVSFAMWFAAPAFGWWMPRNVSSYGDGVDFLFYLILAMTTFFFVLTEVILCYAMYRFEARPGEKSKYTHGNHRLEVLWTVIPGVLLILIAVVQIPVWANMKYQKTMPGPDVTISVTARQWEWRMRTPAHPNRFFYELSEADKEKTTKQRQARGWAENVEIDDIHTTNELHSYRGANTKIYLRTLDVLHSFTMPNLRIKQDTLPGKTIPMWFNAIDFNCRFDAQKGELITTGNRADNWEIACQELCGGRHYAMRGRVYIHEDRQSYDAWLAHAKKMQSSRELPKKN
jgi:cytochrome c oxidase subunit 2